MIKEAQKKYNKEHIKRIPLDMQIELYNQIKEQAIKDGKPVNQWIKEIIKKELLKTT